MAVMTTAACLWELKTPSVCRALAATALDGDKGAAEGKVKELAKKVRCSPRRKQCGTPLMSNAKQHTESVWINHDNVRAR